MRQFFPDVASSTPAPTNNPPKNRFCVFMARASFSQRRKLLRHTLGRWLEARNFAGEFNVQRRAEEVSVHEYTALAAGLSTPL